MGVGDQVRRLAGRAGDRVARAGPGPCGRPRRRRTSRPRPGPRAWSGRGRSAGRRPRRSRTAPRSRRSAAPAAPGSRLRSARRLAVSNDWMNTAGPRAGPGGGDAASASSGSSSDSPSRVEVASGAWSPGRPRSVRPLARDSSCGPVAAPRRGSGTSNMPSYRVLSGRTSGSRSFARSVFSSARVKSSVNQPVTARPSITLVVRRSANSGVLGDVGGAADLVLVPGDQDAVLRGDEVGLDVVGAQPDREPVRREGVLGPVAGGAAVADHERARAVVGHGCSPGRAEASRARSSVAVRRWP